MQLPASIQQARSHLERADEKLTHISEFLPAAKKRKMASSRRQYQLKRQVSITRAKQAKLRANRDNAQRQIEIKEKELKLLETLLSKGEQTNQDLVGVITSKETEIAELKGSMVVAKHELSLAKEEAQQLRDQLHQTMAELIQRAREVHDIERAQTDLEREKRRFDMLLSTYAAITQVHAMTAHTNGRPHKSQCQTMYMLGISVHGSLLNNTYLYTSYKYIILVCGPICLYI